MTRCALGFRLYGMAHRVSLWRCLPALLVGCGALLVALPAQAQSEAGSLSSAQSKPGRSFCSVQTNETLQSAMNDPKAIMAICGSRGAVLGHAEDYTAIPDESAKAVLVDIRNKSGRKIVLVSDQADGPPLVEELSGQISLSAGLGPMTPLEEIDVDLTSFASDGVVRAQGRQADAKSSPGTVNLREQVQQGRAARAAIPRKN